MRSSTFGAAWVAKTLRKGQGLIALFLAHHFWPLAVSCRFGSSGWMKLHNGNPRPLKYRPELGSNSTSMAMKRLHLRTVGCTPQVMWSRLIRLIAQRNMDLGNQANRNLLSQKPPVSSIQNKSLLQNNSCRSGKNWSNTSLPRSSSYEYNTQDTQVYKYRNPYVYVYIYVCVNLHVVCITISSYSWHCPLKLSSCMLVMSPVERGENHQIYRSLRTPVTSGNQT